MWSSLVQVIYKVIDAVDFSFYDHEEVHAISVKHVSNPVLFDNLKNPVPGGLYDQTLGPLDRYGTYVRFYSWLGCLRL